jgi:hypothetical protein
MRRHWQYLKYVLRHKWYVFQECLKIGVPLWIAIFHDWDKFLPDEWFPYANYFYGNIPKAKDSHLGALAGMGIFPYTYEDCERDFAKAWNAHQKRNKHHWQFWMITWDRGETECLPMPDIYRREMIADWHGAGRAINGTNNTLSWYLDNYYKIKLHKDTRLWVDRELMGMPDMIGTLEDIANMHNGDVLLLKQSFLQDAQKFKAKQHSEN